MRQPFATLEERIHALQSEEQCGEDLDATSWGWVLLLGIAAPVAMLLLGWWL